MGSKRVTAEQMIERFKAVHGNVYDYSGMNYIDMSTKIDIICHKHGVFHQVAKTHLIGSGCMKCYIEKKKITFSDVLDKFVKVHGNTYCYDNVDYINTSTKISITCLTHGDFIQKPSHHIMGRGCPKCIIIKNTKPIAEIICDLESVHGSLYDYSNLSYKNSYNKVDIICHKHGNFKQSIDNHKRGQGCPKCSSSKGEKKIRSFFEINNIEYIEQYPICLNADTKRYLRSDFYIPSINTVIEYDGIQHFKANSHFGGEKEFESRVKRDNIKNEFCKEHKIVMLRISYKDYKNINNILSDLLNDLTK